MIVWHSAAGLLNDMCVRVRLCVWETESNRKVWIVIDVFDSLLCPSPYFPSLPLTCPVQVMKLQADAQVKDGQAMGVFFFFFWSVACETRRASLNN